MIYRDINFRRSTPWSIALILCGQLCLLAEDAELSGPLPPRTMLTRRPAWSFGLETAISTLQKHFQTATLDGFGFTDDDSPALRAAGAVLDYLRETQKTSLAHIDRLTPYRSGELLEIDEATRRSLEITRTIRTGSREGSLLAVIDKTVTPMGARLLADWLATIPATVMFNASAIFTIGVRFSRIAVTNSFMSCPSAPPWPPGSTLGGNGGRLTFGNGLLFPAP